ncbi:Nucleotide-binding universal stress protein, UspA family [Ectothiorhodospira mobilis]|uniref:Nucleotide-binding universal stress protein, UspA family n=1 Tax=Ectothiorhodospira mobilis TaxID=195064 RepID=A0A1I4R2V3_ECTMO|nr:universal stress protein [Ectothiorhodospira mobilis]SFM46455.1 Nucleotide-binding universal stress protein, UspA family [Ectothiorhodospira mobilis]
MATRLSPVGRLQRLLLATGGGESSAGAGALALDLAAAHGAELLLMRVVLTNPEYESMAPERVEAETAAAREDLEALAGQARGRGIPCGTRVRHGVDPYVAVVQEADESRVDCVVVGRRRRGPLARLVMGDSTARIVGHAPCSVLAVPPEVREPRRHILVATDGSRAADAACAMAAELARVGGVPLTVLSVARPEDPDAERAAAGEAVQRVLDLLKPELAGSGVTLEGMVEQGRPETVIVETAQRRGADLVVVGSHGHGGLERLLMGSVAERVVTHTPCPVMVVK